MGGGLEYVNFFYYESKCKEKIFFFFFFWGGGGGGGGGVGLEYGSFHNYVESERLQRFLFSPRLDNLTVVSDRSNSKIATSVTFYPVQ